jgi:hypothetical protein
MVALLDPAEYERWLQCTLAETTVSVWRSHIDTGAGRGSDARRGKATGQQWG